jgi:ribosomal protein S18 acetylase RimI-like enzyme
VGALPRVIAFLKGIDERASTSVERFRFGTAFLRPELPRVWSRNFVWVDVPVAEPELEPLLAEVERIHADAGLAHRRIVFEDEASGLRAAPRLSAAGWRVEASRVMVLGGAMHPPVGATAVQEVDAKELWTASVAMARDNPDVTGGEATIAQLSEAAEAVAAATHERCFAAVVDGRIASYCRLFSDGETGQIEEVGTVPELRRHGYASAVVSRAIAESTEQHDLTFLLADEGNWPSQWYERLGFHPLTLLREAVISRT